MSLLSEDYSWDKTLKKIIREEGKRTKPCSFFIGKVESVNPLRIRKNQKMVIEESFLTLTEQVKDVKKEIQRNGEKETITIKNALKKGDTVLILQNQGGQEYAVLAKVGEA